MEFDEDLMIPDKTLSFNEGCVSCMGWMNSKDPGSYSHALLEALAKKYKFSLDTPYEKLPEKARDIFIHGTGGEAVKVKINGKLEIQSIELKPEIVDPQEVDMLSDLIIAAVNEAIKKANDEKEEMISQISGQMNLPGLF